MSSRTQRLFYHCQSLSGPENQWSALIADFPDNTAFTSNAFAVNYDDTWKPYSVSDAALLHATLSMVAQHSDFLTGSEESSDNLYHKGQALQLINSRLLKDKLFMSDASLTTVAVLVSLEVKLEPRFVHELD
jgi:hypothetical protein